MILNPETKNQPTNDVVSFIRKIVQSILFFDSLIFKKPAKVTIIKSERFSQSGIAGFATKRWLFRAIGLPDDYFIFTKSNQMTKSMQQGECGAVGCAIHEVRHRFQHYNKKSIITYGFAKQSKYFPVGVVDAIYKHTNPKHQQNQEVFEREFDCSLIEALHVCFYYLYHAKKQEVPVELIIGLISCNEEKIETILKQQGGNYLKWG